MGFQQEFRNMVRQCAIASLPVFRGGVKIQNLGSFDCVNSAYDDPWIYPHRRDRVICYMLHVTCYIYISVSPWELNPWARACSLYSTHVLGMVLKLDPREVFVKYLQHHSHVPNSELWFAWTRLLELTAAHVASLNTVLHFHYNVLEHSRMF